MTPLSAATIICNPNYKIRRRNKTNISFLVSCGKKRVDFLNLFLVIVVFCNAPLPLFWRVDFWLLHLNSPLAILFPCPILLVFGDAECWCFCGYLALYQLCYSKVSSRSKSQLNRKWYSIGDGWLAGLLAGLLACWSMWRVNFLCRDDMSGDESS